MELTQEDHELEAFRILYNRLKSRYSDKEILSFIGEEHFIPCQIFCKELGALESIVKYLRENCGLSLKKIATMLNRTNKNMWHAYNAATKKMPERFEITSLKEIIPIEIFTHKKLSVLEAIVSYMKEEMEKTNHEIGGLLKRDDRTIWTTYKNYKKKKM